MNILNWLQKWYQSNCNGDWEHEYGVKIITLDNPGWCIEIDIGDTDWEDINITSQQFDNSDDDWYSIQMNKGVFTAYGDPSKLEFLIEQFRFLIVDKRP
jgi:hypothetical protein